MKILAILCYSILLIRLGFWLCLVTLMKPVEYDPCKEKLNVPYGHISVEEQKKGLYRKTKPGKVIYNCERTK